MTDLPRRLRDGYHSLSGRPTVEEAADRIEQQEAELASLRALKAKVDQIGELDPYTATVPELLAELAWLRETAGPPRPSLDSLLAGTEFEGQLDD